ncbi:MAG: cytochrome c peroxidase [Chitinophagaceae bacterium]
MKKKPLILLCIICVTASTQISFTPNNISTVDRTLDYFNREVTIFSTITAKLHETITAIDTNSHENISNAKTALITCRNQYKKIAFFLEYFFPSEAHLYNAAPITEVEDAELELIEPMGLQQIESLLYQPDLQDQKKELLIQSEVLYSSAEDLRSLLYQFSITDAQVLESVRIELIRILTLYITGYDAPELKTGITEANTATTAIHEVLNYYIPLSPVIGKKLSNQLEETEKYLAAHTNFDTFLRMEFLQRFGLPLQTTLGLFIKSLHLELNTSGYLNYDVPNIFSKGALKAAKFQNTFISTNDLTQLGEMLFSENALSINNTRSCASCHQPGKYFTDMLPKSATINGHGTVTRNAPTLLYAGLQHAQFWDGRAVSIPELVRTVIANTEEMNGNEQVIMQRLMQDSIYRNLFSRVYPSVKSDSLGLNEIARSLAAYIQTLNPMNSAFDKYIQGDKTAMNANEVKGFDLFMGKAKCATCHFAPVFNSLLPPYYNVSEYEVIGTTTNDDMNHPVKDTDRGRFTTYPVKYYDGSFKTPTVRNAAKTPPYMHNGAFGSLDTLIEFYNKGGGQGIGILNELQTLSPAPLNLSTLETTQLIQFINTLTDESSTTFQSGNIK